MVSNPNLTSLDNGIRKKLKKSRVGFFNTNVYLELIPSKICLKSTLFFGYSFYKTVFLSVMSHITKFKPKTGFL